MIRLRLFAKWLQDEDTPMEEGTLERRIEQAKIDTKREIGDMLDEILNLTETQVMEELIVLEELKKR